MHPSNSPRERRPDAPSLAGRRRPPSSRLRALGTALLAAWFTSALACPSPGSSPAGPKPQPLPKVDPGIVNRPPSGIDPEAIHRPPPNVDPGILERPPAPAARGQPGGATPTQDTRRAAAPPHDGNAAAGSIPGSLPQGAQR